ncbi:hypothetical protein ABZP36_004901 [Zizania latifolia]
MRLTVLKSESSPASSCVSDVRLLVYITKRQRTTNNFLLCYGSLFFNGTTSSGILCCACKMIICSIGLVELSKYVTSHVFYVVFSSSILPFDTNFRHGNLYCSEI